MVKTVGESGKLLEYPRVHTINIVVPENYCIPMNQGRGNMKTLSLSTIFGICAMLIGGVLVCMLTILPLLRFLMMGKESMDYFLPIITLPVNIPGCLAVYFGFRLIKEKNKRNIKRSAGALAVMAVLLLSVLFASIMPNSIGDRDVKHGFMLSLLLATIAVIPIYILISRFLMIRAGLTPKPKGEFVGKGIILILAWQIWLAGSEIARIYDPKEPWGITFALCVFGPTIIAYTFYKVSMRLLREDKTEQAASSNPAPLDT
ncbi:MAG: hypothetical protein WCI51_11980 [Lentisphaerota bacterium]